ncbi:hypothetical protein NQ318_005320 [Aromia moschata]|uniref:Uncharacterized protein n=1 Tax=Aromia moschata TaxID=1265417 RepID=A0AAV8XTC4_9CUCU|nr:hypothetical protein NQ318_005320 [Aromia moschata]
MDDLEDLLYDDATVVWRVIKLKSIIKGIIGICCSKNIGEFGLGLLIDLPKPLDEYQEDDLKERAVAYDSDNEAPGQKIDRYKDDDNKEAYDTRYVISQMRLSQISLQQG